MINTSKPFHTADDWAIILHNSMLKSARILNHADMSYSEFLGMSVFHYVADTKNTYQELVSMTLEVCQVILNKEQSSYFNDIHRYMTFIVMINFPFLYGALTWDEDIINSSFDAAEYNMADIYINDTSLGESVFLLSTESEEFIRGILLFANNNGYITY